MTAFVKQCWEVWRTWINWPVFRVLLLVMLAQWLVQLGGYSLDLSWRYQGIQSWLGYFLSAAAFLDHLIPTLLAAAVPIMVFGRIKSQMASWRSALTPHHRIPHLLVGFSIGGAIFLLMAVLPAGASLWREYQWEQVVPVFHYNELDFLVYHVWPAIGDLTWLLFAAALIGWLVVTMAAWIVLPMIALAFSLYMLHLSRSYFFMGIGTNSLFYEVDMDSRLIILLIFLDSLLLISLWLRLAHMPVGTESISADERVPWLSAILVKTKSRPAGGLVQSGLWRRAGHRRLMGLGRRFVWLLTIYTAGLVFLITMAYRTPSPVDALSGEFAFGAFFLGGVVSILAIGLSWPRHFAELNEVELMRPAPRRDCAKEIGLAMLFDAAELCVAMTLAVIAVSEYWVPAGLRYPAFWILLAATILAQFLTFGLIVWTMLLRSTAASVIALALAVLSFTMLLYFTLDDRVIFPALLAAAIGITLTIHAHRRWLRADMA